MEIKKSFDFGKWFRRLYFVGYFALLMGYIIVGLQPAEAANYEAATDMYIPKIDLYSDIVTMHLDGRVLHTPDYIVGRFTMAKNKTLLVGHRHTIFGELHNVAVGDTIWYDDTLYRVEKTETLPKPEINMNAVLAPAEKDTIVIMTCAGEDLEDGDASHRFMITAVSE